MKITSVKLLNEGASIAWQTTEAETVILHQAKNGAEPAPTFQNAVSDLKADVEELMEVTAKWMETVTVKGLSVDHDDDGTLEVSLSFTKKFKSGRAVGYSTPRVRQRTDHSEKGSSFMSEELEAKVKTVLREAEAYVGGLRAQTAH